MGERTQEIVSLTQENEKAAEISHPGENMEIPWGLNAPD